MLYWSVSEEEQKDWDDKMEKVDAEEFRVFFVFVFKYDTLVLLTLSRAYLLLIVSHRKSKIFKR